MVQTKGMRPLDSRLSVERAGRAKNSTWARSRTCGLAAAKRAMPTSPQPCPEVVVAVYTGISRNVNAPSFAFYSPFVNNDFWRPARLAEQSMAKGFRPASCECYLTVEPTLE